MSYDEIANSEISVETAIKATTGLKLRDNPLAIASGDVSAPRVVMAAHQAIAPLYFSGAGGTAQITGLDGISTLQFNSSGHNSQPVSTGGAETLTIRVSNDGGTTWSSLATILNIQVETTELGFGSLNMATGLLTSASTSLFDQVDMAITEVDTIEVSSNASDTFSRALFMIVGAGRE